MCGLIFVMRRDGKPARRVTTKRYQAQKGRGQEGYGYLSITDWKLTSWMQAENETEILSALEKDISPTILFHHRMPTSTPNVTDATHPIRVSHELLQYDYYFIHNGIITNCDELKKVHNTQGFTYTTELKKYLEGHRGNKYEMGSVFNDSESLAVELALYIEKLKHNIDTSGSIAFVGVQVNKTTQEVQHVYYGRNHSNPLKLHHASQEISIIASEGGGEEIPPHTLFKYNPRSNETTETPVSFGYRFIAPDDRGYGYPRTSRWDDDYEMRDINDVIEEAKERHEGFKDFPETKNLSLPAKSLPEVEDDEEDIQILTDPADALIEMYEELAKFEDFYKEAEARNSDVGMKIWDDRIIALHVQIKEAKKIIDDLALKEAVENF